MQNVFQNLRKLRIITFLLMVLFSLAPCKVKNSWISALGGEFSKPFGKSQTAISGTSCFIYSDKNNFSLFNQKKSVKKSFLNQQTGEKQGNWLLSICTKSSNSDNFSGNSPPKYILYKCLKVDMV